MKNLFFIVLLSFIPSWDFKPASAIHADSPCVCIGDRVLYLYKIKKLHLKCVVIHGSLVNVLRQPILFSFSLDKTAG